MKKISTLLAAVAVSAAANAISAETWCMPGTYQDWSLEKNIFEANGDGTYSQTIEDLYGDFKVVMYEGGSSWSNQWCSNGSPVENKVAYEAKKIDNGPNIMLAGDNMHYINAKVTITPGENDALTILVEAERVENGQETWQLVGDAPLAWNFTTAPAFTKGDNNEWTLAYTGTITGTFKVVKNAAWANSYSTAGAINLGEVYTLTGPQDPIDNMSPAAGPWEDPTFTLTVGDTVTLKVTTGEAGVEAIEADALTGEAVYYNLQGQRVANPENGLFIRLQGGKATKVAL
ncbi:MAG: hypothetical protein K2L39_06540 [Muribaculaceae bacterium]|nr:hypothetical protein [Muribaculaceae bacterium]MDE6360865.1 hypothetical protein [Muribaculaceae bacterium]